MEGEGMEEGREGREKKGGRESGGRYTSQLASSDFDFIMVQRVLEVGSWLSIRDPIPPSIYLGRRGHLSHDKIDQAFTLRFCIL